MYQISAIICTHERPASLRRTLQSLLSQTLEKGLYEIVVVDNTKDGTARETVAEFLHADIHYLHEPVIGLSRARNTGCEHARGKYVAYIDDDATAERDWLEQILAAFALPQRPACVGGGVNLTFEAPRPSWLADELLFCLGRISFKDTRVTSGTHTYLHGCNIAFERQAVQACGGFNVKLGRVGKRLISYEETMIQDDIEKRGGVCLYSPNIKVTHMVPKERLTKKWFLKRMFFEGVSEARMRAYQGELPFPKRVHAVLRELSNVLYEQIPMGRGTEKGDGHLFTQKCMRRKNIGMLAGLCGF